MRKTFVLDTNVLLHSAESLESFADNIVVLPMAVLEELDRFKAHNDELGRNARHVVRRLDELRGEGRLRDGVPLPGGGQVRVAAGKGDMPMPELSLAEADHRILRVAWNLQAAGERVIFVSKDINARIKADALGIEVMDFERQKVNFDEMYTGCREVAVPPEAIEDFYRADAGPVEIPSEVDLHPNEFVVLRDSANPKHSALGRAAGKHAVGRLCPRSESAHGIKARSKEQRMALELLLDPAVQIVTLVGQAGTGKTFLALAAALDLTQRQHQYDRILVTRPVIPMGKDIGYLPGAKDEKLAHWMQPIFDNLTTLLRDGKGDDERHPAGKRIEELLRTGVIELEALTYIRGRSIPRQFVIVDEAQNLTPHEVKTIVSRAGEGTKMVLCGDPYQIDNPYLDSASNGLTYTAERLKDHIIHGHVMLRKSERSVLAAVAAENL